MTKFEFIFIYISKGVFPELGMQLFSLCHEARKYGATFPHSKMISHSPVLALLSPSGEVLKIRPFLDKVKEPHSTSTSQAFDKKVYSPTC